MKLKHVIAVAWVLGMLLAPGNLILLGNSVGSIGAGFIILLFFTMFTYIIHSRNYKNLAAFRQGAAGEFGWIAEALGPVAALIFSIASRVLMAIFLATGALVASGFVFNEVFVQRFPNFAFAFLMLGTLLAINLYSRELSEKTQILLSSTAVTGILVLFIAGIFEWLKTCEIVYTDTFIPPLKGAFSVLLLFVGFDLLTFSQNNHTEHALRVRRHLIIGLLIAGIVFCLWGMASFLYVPADRLAGTTIPHILAARKILGQPGRIIMGLVIISGTGAAINALFAAVGRMMAAVSRQAYLPFLPQRFFNRSSNTMIFLALVIATMMALGVAGTDALDTYIRGSLILWLLNYAVINFTLILPGARRPLKVRGRSSWRQIVLHGAIFMFMFAGSAVLFTTDDNVGLLVRYFIIILIAAGLVVWLGRRVQARRRRNYALDNK
jgi:amino acid transporter